MNYSPAFWVAVSFLIFILFAWNFIRRAFLSVINNYRNGISSTFGELGAQKDESFTILDNSQKELSESNLNGLVLNAHKVAKEILDDSAQVLASIKQHSAHDVEEYALSIKKFIEDKTKHEILNKTAATVKAYLEENAKDFTKLAGKQLAKTPLK